MSTFGTRPSHDLRDPLVEDARGRKFGPFQGFVADRRDPEKRGRVKVRLPALLQTGGSMGTTGWADPKGAGLAVPPEGASVWVEFEQGYLDSPVYSWGWPVSSTEAPATAVGRQDPTWAGETEVTSRGFGIKVSATLRGDPAREAPPVYPYCKAYKSESGVILELDDTPGHPRVRVQHPSGTTVLIDPDGTVSIRAAGGIALETGGDMSVVLGKKGTFKVVYPEGPAFALGPSGIVLSGPQVNIMGRSVVPSEDDI